ERQVIIDELEKNFLAVDDKELDVLIDRIEGAKKIFFFGQGREMMMLSAFAMRVFHMGYDAYVVGEPHVPPIGKGDILIMSIGVGSSPWTGTSTAQLEAAKNANAVIIVLSAHPELVPKSVDYIVHIPGQTMLEKPDALISIQTMGTPYEQALLVT
ncbi:phosphoheptose isomerase family protein, partial [Treponema sp. R80B11-R83G3]